METKLDIGNDGLWGVLDSKKEELKNKDKIKILFLDCDGVINNMYQFRAGKGGVKIGGYGTASINNIMPFNKLVDFLCENDYYIVYSTAWNHKGTNRVTKCLEDIASDVKLKKIVLGCTPYIYNDGYSREDEIKMFIDTCGVEVEKVCVIDDHGLGNKGLYDDVLVSTHNMTGMLDWHVVEIINILHDNDVMYI